MPWAGEWQAEKHGTRARRTWRKLHLAVDASTSTIIAAVLTPNDVGDPSQVGPLLDQTAGPIASVTVDGAYDGEPVYQTVAEREPHAAVVIPPRATVAPSATAATDPSPRDRHLQTIAEAGRLGWQKATAYGRRALAETTMGRYKQILGNRLHARTLPAQQAEAALGVAILNRMLAAGRPCSVRVA